MLRVDAKYTVENKGRVAAYKWALVPRTLDGVPTDRGGDFFFGGIPGTTGRNSSIRLDDTILPGCTCTESKVFGVQLRPAPLNEETVRTELATMLVNLKLTLQLATENSPGASKEVAFEPFVDVAEMVEMLKSKGVIEAKANASSGP